MSAVELVLQPPPFKLKGSRPDPRGNKWLASIEIETPYGPAGVEVSVTIPEALRALAANYFHKAVMAATANHLRWMAEQKAAHSAGFLGVSLPNPAKLIARAAKKVTKAAKAAANKAFAMLPAPARGIVGPLLKQVATAANPAMLASVVRKVARLGGSFKIPGTDIPIMALSPIGAAVVFGTKIIGQKATDELLDEATSVAQEAVSAGAVKQVAKAAAVQKAKAAGKHLATNAQFAKEVGIPTLNIPSDLHDAGRMLVSTLRGVYVGNPEMRKRLAEIGTRAAKGDVQAKILWALARQISDAARGVKAGYMVGDGYGPGYGVAGYQPPVALAYRLARTKEARRLNKGRSEAIAATLLF